MNPRIFSELDTHYMQGALRLAKKGRFTSSPNPNVGCVIVANTVIVGEGFHQQAGSGHAEVNALAIAQEQAENATCYVTLEPCSHFGRTPPCAMTLIRAGVKRVVVAMVDPNPKVAGRGIKMLQEAGITVDVGLLENEAMQLNRGFIKRMQVNQPRITVKLASSLDGKTALKNGQSQWITGPDARCDVQYFRALQSAILTGSGTVIADNPSLNVRYEALKNHPDFDLDLPASEIRQPIRIILDSHNKLTLQEKLFSLSGRVLLVSLAPRDFLPENQDKIVAHVEQLICADDGFGRINLHNLLTQLNDYEINDLWVEAGATLAGEFFNQQLVDEFILYQATKLMGDQAKNLINLPNYAKMDDVVQLKLQNVALIGNDIRIISHRE